VTDKFKSILVLAYLEEIADELSVISFYGSCCKAIQELSCLSFVFFFLFTNTFVCVVALIFRRLKRLINKG